MVKSWWKEKRIDVYLAAVIIPSVILSVLALWTLFGLSNQISIFASAMIILALLLILVIGSYLSTHNLQRQIELARLKDDFVSTVSHELKTPLTSIRLLAERLVKLPPEEAAKHKEYHSLILTQSYRLSHLINNILDFSKLKEGKQTYKFEKIDLNKLVRESIEEYPASFIRADCKLEINLAGDLPLFYLDKEAVSRAFINLLDNALKFSPAAGVIKISTYESNKEAHLEVIDQGPGIDGTEKKKIFERFYHTGKGTGLGLTIARHIVEEHNGRLELESEKGKGSKFKIILPLKDKT